MANFVKITYINVKHKKKLLSLLKLKKTSKQNTWVVSDSLKILHLAARANCKTILLANGEEREWNIHKDYFPYLIAASTEYILNFLYLINCLT